MEIDRGAYVISTDRSRLQIDMIYRYLSGSYWARSRTREQTETAIENSICFGLYHDDRQIGFTRVVSDHATFAYLGDVFILEGFRGQGLGKWLMETVIVHPDLQGIRRWLLATRDAHGLYEKVGFGPLKLPERWMERPAPNAY